MVKKNISYEKKNISDCILFLKQYGEIRTGTNFLRFIIENNLKNTVMFSSIFGWKHGKDYELRSSRGSERAKNYSDWINKKKIGSNVTDLYGRRIKYSYKELYQCANKLNVIITYKKLDAWIYSVQKFKHPNDSWEDFPIDKWIQYYFDNYTHWLKMNPILVINHENLLNDEYVDNMLTFLSSRYNVKRNKDLILQQSEIKPSPDDNMIIDTSTTRNDIKTFYNNREYLNHMPNFILDKIKSNISRNYELYKKLTSN
jgi:hypothetical protein